MPNVGNCCTCGCEVWIPQTLHDAAKHSAKINFHCAYGHPMVFAEGDSETQKLRRERDRLKQNEAYLEDQLRAARERADKAEAATKRLKKRTSSGTCPCCKRTFSNMAQHMKHMHPQFVADGGAKVVPIKRESAVL